ncbi:MAG: hypothetical protein CMN85_10485 [Spongiibacteraceae bacterium]|nr:hypothetical protein [Spongiibacteraceae bacterium]|tara:strand:+ start:1875 stop:2102 length:228 start_codon:yes stop_codon:yes gene_type:complete
MTPRQFYQSTPRDQIEKICRSANTTFDNFKQIAIASGSCGKKLAERLAESSGGSMTELEILYPERYEDSEPTQAA